MNSEKKPHKMVLTSLSKEDGTSLVELLIAVGISLIVITVVTTSLVQFMLVSRWGNQQLLASNSLQTAALWLGRDVPESHSFTPGSGTVYGTFNWEDSSQQFRYMYDSANQIVIRQHLVDGNLQSITTTARYIANQNDVTFSISGDLITTTITATRGDVSETLSLDLAMRSN